MRRFAIAIAAGISLTACKSEPAGEGAACSKKEDCAEGLNCLDGTCTKLEDDASAVGIRRASIVYYFADKRAL